MKLFYDEVRNKRKGKRMRLQVDNEFQQVKIKDLNDLDNVDMFITLVRGSKAFATEQKLRELKTRIAKLNVQKVKISPAIIIERSTFNMDLMKSSKHGLSPEEIEPQSLPGKRFKTIFNMHRLEKTQKLHRRQDAYDIRGYSTKKRSFSLLRESERKLPHASFYKHSVHNMSYFSKDKTFTRIRSIGGIKYYWLKDTQNNKNLTKRFQRTELFALRSNCLLLGHCYGV